MTAKNRLNALLAGSAVVFCGATGAVAAGDLMVEPVEFPIVLSQADVSRADESHTQSAGPSVEQELDTLRQQISQQQDALLRQQRQLFELEQRVQGGVSGLSAEDLISSGSLGDLRGTGAAAGGGLSKAPDGPVGQREEVQRPEVTVLSGVGGVLTPKGRLVIDPSFEFSHTAVKQFFFAGVQIVDAVLIGAIEATDARRNSFSGTVGGRYGITSRIEVDARVPFTVRDDIENDPLNVNSGLTRDLSAANIGDAEFGIHYQVNNGQEGWPYFIANLRYKSNTGVGPFDVGFDAQGRQLDLPTGSGFHSIEPSVTILYPSDPVVLYGNIGYAINLPGDVDRIIGTSSFGKVDPGDNFRTSFGIGFGINQSVSMSLGYEHNYVLSTSSEINGATVKSQPAQVGSFLFGLSLALTDNYSANLNVAIGATEDAPDVRVSLSTPLSLDLFDY